MYSGEQWAAQDTGHIWVVFCSSGVETQYGSSKVALMMDHWLMPIGANKNDQVIETEVGNMDCSSAFSFWLKYSCSVS